MSYIDWEHYEWAASVEKPENNNHREFGEYQDAARIIISLREKCDRITDAWITEQKLAVEYFQDRKTLRAENERLREALGGVVACHGNNPSDAMADTPEIDYIKYTLMTARRIAKEALNAQETS